MTVSLIIPAFNEENYISPCLESILTQTRLPDEIVICNNASTDGTVGVIKKYIPKLPIKLITEPRQGIRFAVESAWRSASSDIILRCDADCLLPKDWIEKYVNYFEAHPQISAIGGSFRVYDSNNLIKLLTPFAVNLNQILLKIIKGYPVIYGGNFGIRTTVIKKINGYQSGLSTKQDDLIISQKLAQSGFQCQYLNDLWNYTSARRFKNIKDFTNLFLSGFLKNHYQEKST